MEMSRRSFLFASSAALTTGHAVANASTTETSAVRATPAAGDADPVSKFITDQWKQTIRNSDPSKADELVLPKPFTVPTAGETFHYFFYWDTYFTSVGLLLDKQHAEARDNADNMIFLAQRLGFIPNINIVVGQNRTQLPVASALYADVFNWSRDKEWLATAYDALERELAFFHGMRATPCGLNRGYHHATPAELWHFADGIRSRLPQMPEEPEGKMQAASHALAECEVWDFTPRFDRRCADFCAVDTNVLLYLAQQNAATMCELLGKPATAGWKAKAQRRRDLLTQFCWNEERGMFFDYDWVNKKQSPVVSAANFFAMWCGAASDAQAKRIVENLGQLEFAHGVTTCAPGVHKEVYQWDHPNAWPPLQFAAIEGLRRYGFQAEANRIAAKYVATVRRNFATTGNLWEKYNAVTGGVDVRNEYEMPAMLGWSAGVYLHALEILKPATASMPIRGEINI
jgi:alpha,alpha-trehalase